MPHVGSYDHRTGTHCGAATLRNVAEFYNWGYDEAECFGFGAGLVFDAIDRPDASWSVPRASAAWLVEAFFENHDVPHFVGENEPWDVAWPDVTDTVDGDDPVLLALDAGALPYLADADVHEFPHVAALIGYDEDTVTLSDATVQDTQTLSQGELREAWTIDGLVTHENRYLTVTRPRRLQDEDTAAARAVNQTVDYFQQALDAPRTTGAPGDEGIPALRTFADEVTDWSDLEDPSAPVGDAVRALDWHGDRTAYRELYADALAELAPRANLGGGWHDKFTGVADEWRAIIGRLADVAAGEADPDEALEEAGSRLAEVAEREEQFFDDLNRRI